MCLLLVALSDGWNYLLRGVIKDIWKKYFLNFLLFFQAWLCDWFETAIWLGAYLQFVRYRFVKVLNTWLLHVYLSSDGVMPLSLEVGKDVILLSVVQHLTFSEFVWPDTESISIWQLAGGAWRRTLVNLCKGIVWLLFHIHVSFLFICCLWNCKQLRKIMVVVDITSWI